MVWEVVGCACSIRDVPSLHGITLSSLAFKLQLSFEISEYTANVDGLGTLRLLDAIRTCKLEKTVKLYQVRACSLTSSVLSKDKQLNALGMLFHATHIACSVPPPPLVCSGHTVF